MLSLFVSAFVLGLLFNATPGAVFVETLRRGIKGGFAPAFNIQIGSLVGDFIWAVVGLTGIGIVFTLPAVEKPLAIVGAALLAWLAWLSFKDAVSPIPPIATNPDHSLQPAFGKAASVGMALSLSNPLTVAYWAALGGTVTALGASSASTEALLVFLAGFMTSSLLWCFVCASLVAWTRRYVSKPLWTAINLGCGSGLLLFSCIVIGHVV